MVSRFVIKPLFACIFAALVVGAASSTAEESPGRLTERLQALADQETFRLRIVGHIEGEGGNVPESADVESAIKRLIPKTYSFVLGFGPDHSIASLTVYGTDPSAISPYEEVDYLTDSLPTSDLTQSVERQAGLTSDEVARDLADTLSDRSVAEVRAKLTAIELLADMPLESARHALEQGLGAREPEVRLAAIKAIEQTGSVDAVFLLAQAFHVEVDPTILKHLRKRFEAIDHPLAAALTQSEKL